MPSQKFSYITLQRITTGDTVFCPWARHFILCLVLVHLWKTEKRPDMAEKLLTTGTYKSINTNKTKTAHNVSLFSKNTGIPWTGLDNKCTPDRRQSKTLLTSTNAEQDSLETVAFHQVRLSFYIWNIPFWLNCITWKNPLVFKGFMNDFTTIPLANVLNTVKSA